MKYVSRCVYPRLCINYSIIIELRCYDVKDHDWSHVVYIYDDDEEEDNDDDDDVHEVITRVCMCMCILVKRQMCIIAIYYNILSP